MVWSSITFAKFLTPLMGDNIFNPGGDHGAFVVEYVENIIGSPGLIAILAITMIAFLTYLTSETITVIKKLLNPVGYLRDKVKFTIVQHNIEKDKNWRKHSRNGHCGSRETAKYRGSNGGVSRR